MRLEVASAPQRSDPLLEAWTVTETGRGNTYQVDTRRTDGVVVFVAKPTLKGPRLLLIDSKLGEALQAAIDRFRVREWCTAESSGRGAL